MLRKFLSLFTNTDTPSDHGDNADASGNLVTAHERVILNNVLALRDVNASEMMIPRADIIALDVNTPHDDILSVINQSHVSRMPVFADNLDNILGTVHIKDFIKALTTGDQTISIRDHLTDVPIVSPAMPALDLILKMRKTKRHMVLVVDEYGGIDGLITLGDVIETIIGVIDDEHDDNGDDPQIMPQDDGSIIADGRIDIAEFEQEYGEILTALERDEIDTLGGLAFTVAGRVPARGEILKHTSGMTLEILDADPRRIHKICLRDLPPKVIDTPDATNAKNGLDKGN